MALSDRVTAKMLRMSDTEMSEAARQLVTRRWGPQRPIRLARELALRIDELPPAERDRLHAALDDEKGRS
jgi:hypothetical protein